MLNSFEHASFFVTSPVPEFFHDFGITLGADNHGLISINLKNYHIFGMLWACPFTWYHARSYLFKKFSNLCFSFSSFCVFGAFSTELLVKTLNLKVWTLPLIFVHDFILFVIDMYQSRPPLSLSCPPSDQRFQKGFWMCGNWNFYFLIFLRREKLHVNVNV